MTDRDTHSDPLVEKFDAALERLASASPFAKLSHQQRLIDVARRLLGRPGGVDLLAARAPRFDAAGVFSGTDWDRPETLQPQLVRRTFDLGETPTVALECLSLLRLLALVRGEARHDDVHPEQARHFLTQVLALDLPRLLNSGSEADRERLGALGAGVGVVLQRIMDEIGVDDMLGRLIDEIWRILAQRPLQLDHVKAMIGQIAVALAQGGAEAPEARLGADRLVSALFGPTQHCIDDPGIDAYVERLATMDGADLAREAQGLARAMHDTGLVSDYHAVFVRWLCEHERAGLLGDALGLSATGLDSLRCFPALVERLVLDAVSVETAQCVLGLALLLERGLLYQPTIAPALWRQIHLEPSAQTERTLLAVFGASPAPRRRLLAGIVALLGQPLGIGQGNNPTCQSARALSMWALADPDHLLNLLVQVVRADTLRMRFEGRELDSGTLPPGLATGTPLDTDVVSTLLVPHLDRIYAEMGRLCIGRGEDPHRWINPEFHGWWVGREFAIAVDVASGDLVDHEAFVRRFYGHYHPYCNGLTPIIHPQPAGLAVTDAAGSFVGWHAITILRIALDQENVMRAYLYNPNNDSGQDWGGGVVVSTQGHGERHGECSLPFVQLASRLYIFHYDSTLTPTRHPAPDDEVGQAMTMAAESWAAERLRPGFAADPNDAATPEDAG
ncbi:MAG: hypothetical protein V2J24_23855 [Pseudomonadales bacterium]|jgi:hypothetical protein|nr:hypothetical protein [Pseudomonadales bacterium]